MFIHSSFRGSQFPRRPFPPNDCIQRTLHLCLPPRLSLSSSALLLSLVVPLLSIMWLLFPYKPNFAIILSYYLYGEAFSGFFLFCFLGIFTFCGLKFCFVSFFSDTFVVWDSSPFIWTPPLPQTLPDPKIKVARRGVEPRPPPRYARVAHSLTPVPRPSHALDTSTRWFKRQYL